MVENEILNCGLVGRCGGCPEGKKSYSEQLNDKLKAVQGLFPEVKLTETPRMGVRDRVDLTWEQVDGEMRLGLYALDSREIVDLPACPMLSGALEAWLKEFRKRAPPIRKGSVRLRVSPAGQRGVWLDFANQDVKDLFSEKTYLQWLSERAFVEIGQRRKALVWREGQAKLTDPVLNPWFETYDAELKPLPLWGVVGGFSQVGFAANRMLVKTVCELAASSGARKWVDLFSGNGNFTLALAARGFAVEAVELDELAVAGLHRSLQPSWPVTVRRADIYKRTQNLPDLAGSGLLVDPPRAGLRETLALLSGNKAPSALIYVSCFSETLVQDSAKLAELGFCMTNLVAVDQFPYSSHAEWVALFDCKAHP